MQETECKNDGFFFNGRSSLFYQNENRDFILREEMNHSLGRIFIEKYF